MGTPVVSHETNPRGRADHLEHDDAPIGRNPSSAWACIYWMRVRVKVPSGVTRPAGDSGGDMIRETRNRAASGRSGDSKLNPASVPASHASRLKRSSPIHWPP